MFRKGRHKPQEWIPYLTKKNNPNQSMSKKDWFYDCLYVRIFSRKIHNSKLNNDILMKFNIKLFFIVHSPLIHRGNAKISCAKAILAVGPGGVPLSGKGHVSTLPFMKF